MFDDVCYLGQFCFLLGVLVPNTLVFRCFSELRKTLLHLDLQNWLMCSLKRPGFAKFCQDILHPFVLEDSHVTCESWPPKKLSGVCCEVASQADWRSQCFGWRSGCDLIGNPVVDSAETGSTISTLLHDKIYKINPKDCQVLSLGDYGKPREILVNQLRLVVDPTVYKASYIPKWCLPDFFWKVEADLFGVRSCSSQMRIYMVLMVHGISHCLTCFYPVNCVFSVNPLAFQYHNTWRRKCLLMFSPASEAQKESKSESELDEMWWKMAGELVAKYYAAREEVEKDVAGGTGLESIQEMLHQRWSFPQFAVALSQNHERCKLSASNTAIVRNRQNCQSHIIIDV